MQEHGEDGRTSALDDRREHLVMSRPNELSGAINRYRGLFTTQLNHHGTIVETYSNTLLSFLVRDTPGPLQTVVKGLFEAVGVRMPYPNGSLSRRSAFRVHHYSDICALHSRLQNRI